jgi:hypothetical protein
MSFVQLGIGLYVCPSLPNQLDAIHPTNLQSGNADGMDQVQFPFQLFAGNLLYGRSVIGRPLSVAIAMRLSTETNPTIMQQSVDPK